MLIDNQKAIAKLQMLDTVNDQLHPATVKACIQAIKEMPGEPLNPVPPADAIKPNMETINHALGIIDGIAFVATDSQAEALTCAMEMIETALKGDKTDDR